MIFNRINSRLRAFRNKNTSKHAEFRPRFFATRQLDVSVAFRIDIFSSSKTCVYWRRASVLRRFRMKIRVANLIARLRLPRRHLDNPAVSRGNVGVIFVRETRGRSIEGFIVVRNAAQGGTRGRKRRRWSAYVRSESEGRETRLASPRLSSRLSHSTYLYTPVIVSLHPP